MAKGQTYDEDFKKTIAPLYLSEKQASNKERQKLRKELSKIKDNNVNI